MHKENTDTKFADFAALLSAGGPIVIDGGLATQCEAMGCNIDGNLWSGVLLRDDPQSIVAANRAYLDAGARIVTTASYQASRYGFMREGASAEEADRLIKSSVALARQARDGFLRDNPGAETPLIAASVGPYGAVQHDGSEYTGDYDISTDELREFHLERLELLDTSDIDLLACETIPSAVEALVLSELLRDAHNSSWISFSCRDASHLVDGTPLAEVAGLFANHPRVLAVGANCVPPDIVVPLIATFKKAVPEKSIVVYPNSGEVYRVENNTWVGTTTPLQCVQAATDWIAAGAAIVGGCCRIGPAQIAAMARSVNNRR